MLSIGVFRFLISALASVLLFCRSQFHWLGAVEYYSRGYQLKRSYIECLDHWTLTTDILLQLADQDTNEHTRKDGAHTSSTMTTNRVPFYKDDENSRLSNWGDKEQTPHKSASPRTYRILVPEMIPRHPTRRSWTWIFESRRSFSLQDHEAIDDCISLRC